MANVVSANSLSAGAIGALNPGSTGAGTQERTDASSLTGSSSAGASEATPIGQVPSGSGAGAGASEATNAKGAEGAGATDASGANPAPQKKQNIFMAAASKTASGIKAAPAAVWSGIKTTASTIGEVSSDVYDGAKKIIPKDVNVFKDYTNEKENPFLENITNLLEKRKKPSGEENTNADNTDEKNMDEMRNKPTNEPTNEEKPHFTYHPDNEEKDNEHSTRLGKIDFIIILLIYICIYTYFWIRTKNRLIDEVDMHIANNDSFSTFAFTIDIFMISFWTAIYSFLVYCGLYICCSVFILMKPRHNERYFNKNLVKCIGENSSKNFNITRKVKVKDVDEDKYIEYEKGEIGIHELMGFIYNKNGSKSKGINILEKIIDYWLFYFENGRGFLIGFVINLVITLVFSFLIFPNVKNIKTDPEQMKVQLEILLYITYSIHMGFTIKAGYEAIKENNDDA